MSLQPREIPPVPEETQRVARAAFPKGNVYVRLRDEIGTLFDDRKRPFLAVWTDRKGVRTLRRADARGIRWTRG